MKPARTEAKDSQRASLIQPEQRRHVVRKRLAVAIPEVIHRCRIERLPTTDAELNANVPRTGLQVGEEFLDLVTRIIRRAYKRPNVPHCSLLEAVFSAAELMIPAHKVFPRSHIP